MNERHTSEWLYLQIYLSESMDATFDRNLMIGLCDELITPHVREWVGHCRAQGWMKSFFFLRFGGEGYHLRLRLKGRPDQLHAEAKPFLEGEAAGFFQKHAAALGLLHAHLSADDLRELRRLRLAQYEPEYEKYGGELGMSLAEEHFEVSSEVSFQVLEAERALGIKRSQVAFELLHILVSEFSAKAREQAFILKTYTHYWVPLSRLERNPPMARLLESNYERQRDDLFRRFDPDADATLGHSWQTKPHNPFPRWREHLREHIGRLKALEADGRVSTAQFADGKLQRALLTEVPGIERTPTVSLLILTNYLHMLCNRLALPPLYEVQMTYLLYRHLEEKFGFKSGLYPVLLDPGS
ncbi:MAG: hypothetical protein QOH51_1236 [Acidobacteriota bacterium]|jgi:thiopeptide-type bacteriocin biosynthesis protein|nr:hypothetical protein [Acidobacteriota bacterium]